MSNEMNIFEQAARKKLRFLTPKGALTVEQVFDLPLESKKAGDLDLDLLYIAIATELEAGGISSPVKSASNPSKTENELRLAIVSHVITAKKAKADTKQQRAAIDSELAQLQALQDQQAEEALKNLKPDEVTARIAALRAKAAELS